MPNNKRKRRTVNSSNNETGEAFDIKNVDIHAKTEIGMEEFTFLWSIAEYPALRSISEIQSPAFLGGTKSKHTWQVRLTPKKIHGGEEFLSVSLILLEFGDGDFDEKRTINVRFQVSLVDANGELRVKAGIEPRPCTFKQLSVWEYGTYMLSKELLDPENRLLNNGTLRVHLKVSIEEGVTHQVVYKSND